ncbi:hypothetical protein OIU34_16610 [Pararhizobium sp. BT-229]|uniref:hypothetical protein n=1 Tax=Pararhizobium sp. BT-229 TaxID=2986923 RepID=UPI0021F7E3D2|nr:hypothetical protein [Pararhizobium sp. BT-229]MCV9963526.1 hypothetical protein [Pararhizobium sp. BT-229]
MKLAAPLPYVDRIEKKKSVTFVVRMDEFTEWDIPEISIGDTTDAVMASASRGTFDGPLEWYPVEMRAYKGRLIRRTGQDGGPDGIRLGHIPRLKDGYLKCDSDSFSRLQSASILHGATCSMLEGHSGYRYTSSVTPTELEMLGRERQRAMAATMLDRLVLVDGELWKAVVDPRIKLHAFEGSALSAEIDFNEYDERDNVSLAGSRGVRVMTLPICEAQRIDQIADKFGLPLAARQIAHVSISSDAPICRDGRLWTAWHAARFIGMEVGDVIGSQSATAVANWLALRDALSIREAGMSAEDVLSMVDALKTSLGPDCRGIVAGTEELLEFIAAPMQPNSLRGPTP